MALRAYNWSCAQGRLRDRLEQRLPARVRVTEDRSLLEAACTAIERATGYTVATCRQDCYSADSTHYELTLGTRISRRYGGGYNVQGRVWLYLPRQGR